MPMILLIVMLAVLFVFSATARTGILNALQATGYLVQGVWARRPTFRTILCYATWPLVIFVIPSIIFFFIVWGIGAHINAPIAGFILGLFFPVWFFLFLLRGIILKSAFWFFTLIVAPAAFYFAIGVWSPDFKGSLNRWTGNKKQEAANYLDKGSLKSEPEMGKFARVKESSQIYNQAGQPTFFVQKGTTVMVKNLDGEKADDTSEGRTRIMLPNRLGDYLGGNEGFIPTRKLDWDWNSPLAKEDQRPAPAPTPAPKGPVVLVQAPQPKTPEVPVATTRASKTQEPEEQKEFRNIKGLLSWSKPEGIKGYDSADRVKSFSAEIIKKDEKVFILKQYFKEGCATFVGHNVGNNFYEGDWSQEGRGGGGGRFRLSLKDIEYASGEVEMTRGQWIPMRWVRT